MSRENTHNPYVNVSIEILSVFEFYNQARQLMSQPLPNDDEAQKLQCKRQAALLVQKLRTYLTIVSSPLSSQDIRSIVYTMGKLAARDFLEKTFEDDFLWVIQVASILSSCILDADSARYRLQEIANVLDGLGLMTMRYLLPKDYRYYSFVIPLLHEALFLLSQEALRQRDFLLSLNGVLTGLTQLIRLRLLSFDYWPEAFSVIDQCRLIFDRRVLNSPRYNLDEKLIITCGQRFNALQQCHDRYELGRAVSRFFQVPPTVAQENVQGPYQSSALPI